MTNLASNLVATAERIPDKVGIRLDQVEVTWSQLHQAAAGWRVSSGPRASSRATASRSSCPTCRPTPSPSTARSLPAVSSCR